MADDTADRDESGTAGDGGFTEEYELATEADVIEMGAADAEPDDEGAVAGSFAPEIEVTPGVPEPENVAFVALGVFIALVSIGRMFVGAAMYAPETIAATTVGVAAGTALLYGLFVRTGDT